MAIAFVDFAVTKSTDNGNASSPQAHARTISVGDEITVIVTSSGTNLVTVTGITDNGSTSNTYAQKGSTVTSSFIRTAIFTTVAAFSATSISVAFTPTPANATSVSVTSTRKTGALSIGGITSASGVSATAALTAPVTQDANNWIEFVVIEGVTNPPSGFTGGRTVTPSGSNVRINADANGWSAENGGNDHMGEDIDVLIASAGATAATISETMIFGSQPWIAFALELRTVPPGAQNQMAWLTA